MTKSTRERIHGILRNLIPKVGTGYLLKFELITNDVISFSLLKFNNTKRIIKMLLFFSIKKNPNLSL